MMMGRLHKQVADRRSLGVGEETLKPEVVKDIAHMKAHLPEDPQERRQVGVLVGLPHPFPLPLPLQDAEPLQPFIYMMTSVLYRPLLPSHNLRGVPNPTIPHPHQNILPHHYHLPETTMSQLTLPHLPNLPLPHLPQLTLPQFTELPLSHLPKLTPAHLHELTMPHFPQLTLPHHARMCPRIDSRYLYHHLLGIPQLPPLLSP